MVYGATVPAGISYGVNVISCSSVNSMVLELPGLIEPVVIPSLLNSSVRDSDITEIVKWTTVPFFALLSYNPAAVSVTSIFNVFSGRGLTLGLAELVGVGSGVPDKVGVGEPLMFGETTTDGVGNGLPFPILL